MSESIVLVGLPGAGKKRFQRVFCQTFPQVAVESVGIEQGTDSTRHLPSEAQIWCVIDIRSRLLSATAESHLKTLLAESTAIVLSFVSEAELSMQVYWQDWLKKNDPKQLPRKRWQGLELVDKAGWQSLSQPVRLASLKAISQHWKPLQSHSMAFGALSTSKRFHLEHLMMVLDAAKNNLAMDLWRVKGCLLTYDYDHPVVIEMTPSRCDVFAADSESDQAFLHLLGADFDQAWLEQAILASQL